MESLTFSSLGQNGFLTLLSAYGAAQGYVLAAVFWFRSAGDRTANRLLAGLYVAVTLHLTEILFYVTGWMEHAPWLSGTGFPLIFLVGPLYFLYTRRLLDPRFRLRPIHLLHAIPAALVLLDSVPWLLTPASAKIPFLRAIAEGVDVPVSPRVFAMLVFNIAQNLAYLAVTVRRVRRAERQARERLSDGTVVQGLASLRTITIGFATYVALHLLLYVALQIWGNRNGALVDTVWLFVISVFLQVLGYTAISRPESFARAIWEVRDEPDAGAPPADPVPTVSTVPAVSTASAPAPAAPAPAEPAPSPDAASGEATPADRAKYRHSSLSADEARLIRERLLATMDEGAAYLRSALTLREVAGAIGASTHHVSQVLNGELGQSFFDFVNGYRVDAARELLLREPDRSVLEIAYEAGFNNKTSFNRAFRERTGLTPTEFRRREARQ